MTPRANSNDHVVSVIDAENRITMETIAKLENECSAVEKFFTLQGGVEGNSFDCRRIEWPYQQPAHAAVHEFPRRYT